MNHLHSFLETVCLREQRLISPRGTFHTRSTCFQTLRNVCFLLARPGRRGWRQKSATQQNNSLVIKSLQTQAARNSQNRLRVSNMLKKHHHHHHHRHRHQNHQFGISLYNFPSKNKQNGTEIFMIHLCTIATLMFLQNIISQKILSIAARTFYPGVVLKYVSI